MLLTAGSIELFCKSLILGEERRVEAMVWPAGDMHQIISSTRMSIVSPE
jgi:hypothetical protein